MDNEYHMVDFLDTFLSVSRRRIYRTVTTLVGEGLEPGDVYTINDTRAGLRDIHCRLLQQPEYNDENSVAITGIFFDRTDYAQSFNLASASFNAQEFPTNTLLPPTGAGATFDQEDSVARVAWAEPDNQADTFAGYTIERKVADGPWDALAVLGEDETSFVDTPPLTQTPTPVTYRLNSRDYLGGTSDWVETSPVEVAVIRSTWYRGFVADRACPPENIGGPWDYFADTNLNRSWQRGFGIANDPIDAEIWGMAMHAALPFEASGTATGGFLGFFTNATDPTILIAPRFVQGGGSAYLQVLRLHTSSAALEIRLAAGTEPSTAAGPHLTAEALENLEVTLRAGDGATLTLALDSATNMDTTEPYSLFFGCLLYTSPSPRD